jgi:hypothetical protein
MIDSWLGWAVGLSIDGDGALVVEVFDWLGMSWVMLGTSGVCCVGLLDNDECYGLLCYYYICECTFGFKLLALLLLLVLFLLYLMVKFKFFFGSSICSILLKFTFILFLLYLISGGSLILASF